MDYLRVVRILRDAGTLPVEQGRVVVYGSFDGLHLGHQRMLDAVSGLAHKLRFALLDEGVLSGPRLASRRQILEELSARNFPVALIRTARMPFDAALAALRPTEIVRLAGEACSPGVAEFPVVQPIETPVVEGSPVTSERLRAAVVAASLDVAEAMIGHPYSVDGRVVHGHHRGAAIGVPTANIRVRNLQLPPDGVYAVTVCSATLTGVGVANLGTVPTFGNAARSLETNIFDFDGDLYGTRLEVGFLQRLRGEKKFDGVDTLVSQIRRDVEAARAIHERR